MPPSSKKIEKLKKKQDRKNDQLKMAKIPESHYCFLLVQGKAHNLLVDKVLGKIASRSRSQFWN
jgi:hypothetical protein